MKNSHLSGLLRDGVRFMTPPSSRILTLNGGSSSIKFALFDSSVAAPTRVLEGEIQGIGSSSATFRLYDLVKKDQSIRTISAPTRQGAADILMDWADDKFGQDALAAVGHRIVFGGTRYRSPERITPEMLDELKRLRAFYPAHLPEEIGLIEAFARRLPGLLQIACFDTGFHRDLPRVAQMMAIPRRYEALGVRRYGFHGLAYEYLVQELSRVAGTETADGKVILAHLGSGASLAALSGRKSVETSMGFTPTSGIPMGTRSGDLDPSLFSYLSLSEGIGAKGFSEMMNDQSGLRGISETSSDMRELLAAEAGDIRAAEAIALFCYQIKKCIGAFAAVLGGLDTLIFSGGIGERSAVIRSRICEGLEFLGVELGEGANAANEGIISQPRSKVSVRVMQANEEQTIAVAVARLLKNETQVTS